MVTMMENNSLGKRLKNARKALGMTADEVAEKCFINPIYLRQLESDRGLPSLTVFVALCNALNVSPTYLLQDQLENTELDGLNEFADLWRRATPAQQQMVLSILRAALATLPKQ